QGFDLPLLIGGATTSRVHTAVKIHPNYRRGQAVYVTDASRAVGVAANLMSRDARPAYLADIRQEYARIAAAHARGQTSKQRLSASALFGFWPANSDGDDILVYGDESRTRPLAVLHTLRQQLARREGRANIAIADFVAPCASGLADYIGAFLVTAGIGEDELAERFKRANDDYSAIMVKA